MSELLTNFKDDILAESMEGRRRYQMITNEDGTVSFVDVTEYEQIGSEFGQAEVNAIHREINRKFDSGDVVDPLAAEESGFAADAKLTGDALREVSVNIDSVFQSVSSGKALVASAITAKGVTTKADATFATMATNIRKINTSPTSLSGNVNVENISAGVTVQKTITFSKAFSSSPKVNASANGTYNGNPYALTVTIASISKAGFTVNIKNPLNAARLGDIILTWNAVV